MKAFSLAAAVALSAMVRAQAPSLVEQLRGLLAADGLKADVSFLASDLLEGRATPSRGLDLAAEYVAAQFRRAGLEPVGDDGYFQTASFTSLTPNIERLDLSLESGGSVVKASPASLTLMNPYPDAIDVSHAAVIKLAMDDAAAVGAVTPDQVAGKVMVLEPGRGARASGRSGLKPAAVIYLFPDAVGLPNVQLREASAATPFPLFMCTDSAFRKALDAAVSPTISLHVAAPKMEAAKLRNVAGLMRGSGSDPALKDTYVLLTGHYDHVGVGGSDPSDRIFNGANDDASGTASVIEIANALSRLPRPKRSIVFMAFFGEELNFVGSGYYVKHPIYPLAQTVLDLNLECLGRTDDLEGPRVGELTMVGFDYTDLPATFARVAEQTGVKTTKHPRNSDAYFGRADSFAFAMGGVPAATVATAYEYPDYHKPGDEWQKLDYENMAKVDRTIALALLEIANNAQAPKWDESNPKTARFVKAREATVAAPKK